MNKKELYKNVFSLLEKNNPEPVTELRYSNPWQLAVAVVLSAQCTDVRVNKITPALFKKFPDMESMNKANKEDVFELIKSCSYPNSKTKYLLKMSEYIIENYNGILPKEIDKLEKIPGIGRKTANVIASVLYDTPVIAVDTHVFRVSNRIGLTRNSKNPVQTEKELTKYIPINKRAKAHHWLILHGRYVCKAKKPDCTNCVIKDYCKYYKNPSK